MRWIQDHGDGDFSSRGGFATATTDEVANGLGIDPRVAYDALARAAKKKLALRREMRKAVRGAPTYHGDKSIGWRVWEVDLRPEQIIRDDDEPTSNSRLTSDKDLQKIIVAAERAGWKVDVTGGGHLVFKSPDTGVPPIFTAKTPGDWRGLKNLRSTLKRHGLVANEFPESVHPNYDVSGAWEDARARDEYHGVAYLVEEMPDGEWRWEVDGATGHEPSERMAHHAARRAIERRLAARSM